MRTCFISKRRHACTLAAELCVTHTHTYHTNKNTQNNDTYHTHTCTITDRQQHKPVILLQYSHLFWLDICRTFYTWWNRKDPIAKPTNQFQRERERKEQWYNNCSGRHQISCTSRHMGSSSNSEILETGSRIDPSGSRVVVFGIVHHHCHLLSSGAGGQKQTGPPTSGLLLISMLTDIVPEWVV